MNSQGEDPRTFEENSQGKDPSTFRGRNLQAKKWRVQKKREEEKWKKRKKKKKKKAKHRKRRWWTKCKQSIASLFTLRKKEDVIEKERRKEARRLEGTQTMVKTWRWLLLLLLLGQSVLGVSAAAEGPQKRTEALKDSAGTQVKGGRWAEEIPQRWRQPKGEGRSKMKKEATFFLRCTLLNGSAWSTEWNYEHTLRKEEMEEQFNREAKKGRRFAADAARITDERTSSEDRKHTSGGVSVAVDSNLRAVIGREEGAATSIHIRAGQR